MSPNFLPNAFVVAIKHPWQVFKVGDVVLVNHLIYGKMIKRINSYQQTTNSKNSAYITLIGDHPASVSTQQMGVVSQSQIMGRVCYCIQPVL